MSAPIIQVTELAITEGKFDAARAAWASLLEASSWSWRLWARADRSALMEIRAFESWPNLEKTEVDRRALWDALGVHAEGDFRRELLVFTEAPKPTNGLLPDTEHLELRHVEVRPVRYVEYRAWREKTIFDVVRSSPEIATFIAYHTAFSTRPGVLFLSGFDGDVDAYRGVFASDRYRQIVQTAGNEYITGSDQGLTTRIYHKVEV